jgi:transposase
MRGADTFTESLFTMRRLDDFVPDNHSLRSVRTMVNLALMNIEPLLSGMYAADIKGGLPSIAPEKLLRAMLLQIFYSIRSERLLMEQTQYNRALSLVHRTCPWTTRSGYPRSSPRTVSA